MLSDFEKINNRDKMHLCEIYSIVMRALLNTGQGGRDKMLKEVNKKYANVTRHALNIKHSSQKLTCMKYIKSTPDNMHMYEMHKKTH